MGVTATAHDPMIPRPARIERVTRETPDTVSFAIDVSHFDGGGLAFEPGQFTMLYVFGIGEVPISISGDPARPEVLVHTVRAVGSVTNPLCAMRKGMTLGVRGPYGTPWPVAAAKGKDVIFVAGGLGLAPLRPAICHVLERRHEYRNVAIVHGARSPEGLLFRKDLARWRGRLDVQVEVTVDHADTEWRGHVGTVTTLLPRLDVDPENAVAFLCGPEIMMRFAGRALEQQGVPRSSIFVSLERNMKCAVGHCGHCQLGPTFVCKDGPVFPLDRIAWAFDVREL